MNSIDEDLKQALRRQEPPAGFGDKVMDLVNSGAGLEPEKRPGPNKVLVFRLRPKVVVWLATAAAAACLVGLVITRSYVADRARVGAPFSGSNLPAHEAAPQQSPDQQTAPGPNLESNENGQGLQRIRSRDERQHANHRRAGSRRVNDGMDVQMEARQAEEQLRLALAITSAKLGYAQRSIQEADGTNTMDREVNP
jgi:hypothetical protein